MYLGSRKGKMIKINTFRRDNLPKRIILKDTLTRTRTRVEYLSKITGYTNRGKYKDLEELRAATDLGSFKRK